MTIHPQSLRAMRDELIKMAAPADRRLAAALAGKATEAAPEATKTVAKAAKPGLLTRLRGAVVDRPLRAGGRGAAEGVVEGLEGPLKTRFKALSGEAGEEAVRGLLRAITPSRKALMAGGAAGVGLGALAGYGMHRARKRRTQDMQRAVAAGVQQGLHQQQIAPQHAQNQWIQS
jgi:hypothetical protein